METGVWSGSLANILRAAAKSVTESVSVNKACALALKAAIASASLTKLINSSITACCRPSTTSEMEGALRRWIFRLVKRSIARKCSISRGITKVIASPALPARPVRPTRWV